MFGTNIFEQLKKEHKEVKSLLEKAKKCPPGERHSLLEEVEENLIPHARGEEKTLYSLLRERAQENQSDEALNLTNEAYEEHRLVDELMEDLKETSANDEKWLPKLKVIKENLEHHIQEEEEELFKSAKKFFSKEEQQELLEAYRTAKEKFEQGLPTQGQIRERTPSEQARQLR